MLWLGLLLFVEHPSSIERLWYDIHHLDSAPCHTSHCCFWARPDVSVSFVRSVPVSVSVFIFVSVVLVVSLFVCLSSFVSFSNHRCWRKYVSLGWCRLLLELGEWIGLGGANNHRSSIHFVFGSEFGDC